uniref:Putative 7 kDa protein n=1 Tax=Ixodes ricinus TaxID=34613 RepID=A0A6B0UJM6_IXORI
MSKTSSAPCWMATSSAASESRAAPSSRPETLTKPFSRNCSLTPPREIRHVCFLQMILISFPNLLMFGVSTSTSSSTPCSMMISYIAFLRFLGFSAPLARLMANSIAALVTT